ncbi:MAG: hypothetical protein WCX79_00685 [Candidatus Paceibacterota bacterium]|jgi:hypothetical protein
MIKEEKETVTFADVFSKTDIITILITTFLLIFVFGFLVPRVFQFGQYLTMVSNSYGGLGF